MTNRLAREVGISIEELTDLNNYQESSLFSQLEKDVLSYVEAVTATPVRVPDDLYTRLETQLSPAQMVELTSAIALENFSARFNRAFEIEPDD